MCICSFVMHCLYFVGKVHILWWENTLKNSVMVFVIFCIVLIVCSICHHINCHLICCGCPNFCHLCVVCCIKCQSNGHCNDNKSKFEHGANNSNNNNKFDSLWVLKMVYMTTTMITKMIWKYDCNFLFGNITNFMIMGTKLHWSGCPPCCQDIYHCCLVQFCKCTYAICPYRKWIHLKLDILQLQGFQLL